MESKAKNTIAKYSEVTMSKQTAVEWLYLQSANKKLDLFDLLEAKAMEKEQIVNTYRDGRTDQQSERSSLWYNRNAEYYYNETYGGQQ